MSEPEDADYRDPAPLRELLARWQPILRLQDWRVKIRWADHHEIKAQANIIANVPLKSAVIRVNPNRHPARDDAKDHLEAAIIHELLHLHWEAIWKWDEDSVEWDMAEQAIHCTALAMMKARYGGDYQDPFLAQP